MKLNNAILLLSMCLLRVDARSDDIVIPGQEPPAEEEEEKNAIYHEHGTPVTILKHGGLIGDTFTSIGTLEGPDHGAAGKVVSAGSIVNAATGGEIGVATYDLPGGTLGTIHVKESTDDFLACKTANIIGGGTGNHVGAAGYVKVCVDPDGFSHEVELKDPSLSPTATLDFVERALSDTIQIAGNDTALGDTQAFLNVLYDESNTEEVGKIYGTGAVVGIDTAVNKLDVVAYELEEGIITGIAKMNPEEKCFDVVITGGKGLYTNAKGTASVCKGDEPDTFVHSVKLSDAAPMTASMSIKEMIQERTYSYFTKEGELMPGDTTSWTSKVLEGENEVGSMYGHTTFAGPEGTDLMGYVMYDFGNGDKLVMIGDPADVGVCGTMAVVGGSGKYLGAAGTHESCFATDGEYDNVITLQEPVAVSTKSGASMRNIGLFGMAFAQLILFVAPLLI